MWFPSGQLSLPPGHLLPLQLLHHLYLLPIIEGNAGYFQQQAFYLEQQRLAIPGRIQLEHEWDTAYLCSHSHGNRVEISNIMYVVAVQHAASLAEAGQGSIPYLGFPRS